MGKSKSSTPSRKRRTTPTVEQIEVGIRDLERRLVDLFFAGDRLLVDPAKWAETQLQHFEDALGRVTPEMLEKLEKRDHERDALRMLRLGVRECRQAIGKGDAAAAAGAMAIASFGYAILPSRVLEWEAGKKAVSERARAARRMQVITARSATDGRLDRVARLLEIRGGNEILRACREVMGADLQGAAEAVIAKAARTLSARYREKRRQLAPVAT